MVARRGPGWVSVLLASSTADCCSCSCTALAPHPALKFCICCCRRSWRDAQISGDLFNFPSSSCLPPSTHLSNPSAAGHAHSLASALLGERLNPMQKSVSPIPLSSPIATATTRRLLLQSIYPSSARGGTQRALAACDGAWRAGPCFGTHGKNDHWPLSEQSSTAIMCSAACML